MSDLTLINKNLGGEGCAALLATFLANNGTGTLRITKEQYENLAKFYRLEMYTDGDSSETSTLYEVRLVAKDALGDGEVSRAELDSGLPPELTEMLEALGADIPKTRH